MKKFFKKHLKLIIGLCIAAVVIAGGWIWLRNASRRALDRLQTATIETATVERRNLVSVVSATGKVTSNDSKSLAPTVSGVKVAELNIAVGDYVKEGDVPRSRIISRSPTTISRPLRSPQISASIRQKEGSMKHRPAARLLPRRSRIR